MSKSIRNYTSKQSVRKSQFDIETHIIEAGGRNVLKEQDANGNYTGIRFLLTVPGRGEQQFFIPVDVAGAAAAMAEDGIKVSGDQAARTAWKNVSEWIELLLLTIRLGAVKPEQALLGYISDPRSGQTLFELYERDQLALPEAD